MATVFDSPGDPIAPSAPMMDAGADSGDTSLVILQSLLCLLREKNVLTRGDIEELSDRVRARAADHARDPLPCCREGAAKAADRMAEIGSYIGRRYGGKHRRPI